MIGSREERKRRIRNKILALWIGKEAKWFTYKEIVEKLYESGVSERTVARYLGTLVVNRELVKEKRGYKKTFYRPSDEFLHKLHTVYGEWITLHEEYLNYLGKTIINKFELTLKASEETDERISKLISEEIDKIQKETPTEEEVFEAIDRVISREKLTKPDSKTLVSLVERFLSESFYQPLANPYGVGTVEPHVLLSGLEDEILSLISAYMDLWRFMYMVPGASFKFQKYMKEKFPNLRAK